MKFKPLHDRVLVRPVKAEDKKGLIFIPDTAKEEELIGEVVIVGPGKPDDIGGRLAMSVKVGDLILFQRYCGFEVELDAGEKKNGVDTKTPFKVIEEGDILGVIG